MSMAGRFKIGDWLVRPEMNNLERAGKVVKVEPRYMDLLVYLAQHQGEVVGSDEIHEHVWAGVVVGDHAVYQAIARLRKALGDRPGKPRYIETVPKRGYRLLLPACPVTTPAAEMATGVSASEEAQRGPRRWRILGGVAAVLVIVAAIVVWAALKDPDWELAGNRTLAVLPFEMLGSQAGGDYLAYGLTVDLLNELGKVRGLEVLGQASTKRFKGAERDLKKIGRRLGVGLLVLGKVRMASGRLQVEVELISTRSGARLWGKRMDGLADDIFGLQDAIAESVIAALGKRYELDRPSYRQSPTDSILNAYDYYLLGQFYERERNRESLERALMMYRRAVDTDPRLPGGQRGVASVSLLLTYYGELPLSQAEDIALRHLERALQLDPDDEANYAIMGLARYLQGEYGPAKEMLKRALAINANDAMAWMWLAMAQEKEGKLRQAMEHYRRAAHLEPLSTVVKTNLASALESSGQPEQALAVLNSIDDVEASSVQYNRVRADLLLQNGELTDAYGYARRALELDPADAMATAQTALVLQDLGRLEEQRDLFDRILERGLNGKAGALRIMEEIYIRLDSGNRAHVDGMISLLFPEDQRMAQIRWRSRAAFRQLSAVYAGRYDEAVALFESVWRGGDYAIVSTDFDLLYCTAQAFSQQARGNVSAGADALAECNKGLRRAREDGWDSQWIDYAAAQIAALSGRHEQAIRRLESLYQRGFNGVGLLQNDPVLEPLRQRPGFTALLEEMNQRSAMAWSGIEQQGQTEIGVKTEKRKTPFLSADPTTSATQAKEPLIKSGRSRL